MKMILALFLKLRYSLLALFISFISVVSLFQPGLPPTHDGEYHVVRFYEFDRTLRDGNWYPLWAANLNYTFGSPLFNYVYPLPNYMASLFHVLGLSFIDSFKANLVAASIFGGVGMYIYGRKRFGILGGILASTAYTFSPYHFLDIYIRGSVGEVWALALFPFALLLFERVAEKKKSRDIAIAAIIYALIVFSHNILAVMFSVFLGTYILFLAIQSKKEKETVIACAASVTLGLLLSAIFFLPALLEQKYVLGLQVFSVENNFPEFFQLLIPSWGSGFSGGSLSNEMSFQIGLANLIVVFVALAMLLLKKNKKNMFYPAFFVIWFFLLVFLMTPFSAGVWRVIPFMNYFQFPWRFLSLVIFCCAILAGFSTTLFKKKFFALFLLAFIILTTYSYAHPAYFMQRNDGYYTTRPNFIYGTNSIGDGFQTKWLPQQKSLPTQPSNVLLNETTRRSYLIKQENPGEIVFGVAYFPGWTGYIDGRKAPVTSVDGKLAVHMPEGKHTVDLRLEDTPVRALSKVLSLIGLLFVPILFWKDTVIQYFYARRN